jgi:hypothetical protein
MENDVRWLDADRTILLWTCKGQWNWNDFDTAFQQKTALQDQVTHEVYIILDFTAVPLFPADFARRVREKYAEPHHRTRKRIVVGVDGWIRRFWDVIATITLHRLPAHFVDTLDEALVYIARDHQRQH